MGATVRSMVEENSRRIGSRQRVEEIRDSGSAMWIGSRGSRLFHCAAPSCIEIFLRAQLHTRFAREIERKSYQAASRLCTAAGWLASRRLASAGEAIKLSDEWFDASRWIFFGKGGVRARKGRLNGSLSYSSSIKARLLKVISRRVARWLAAPR